MNKSYKIVFNKARGTKIVANELTKSHQCKKASAVVVAASIAALFGGVCADANAGFLATATGGIKVTTVSSDLNISAEQVNEKYTQLFPEGMDVKKNAFTITGWTKKGKNYFSSMDITVPSILVKSANTGIEVNKGKGNLGNDNSGNIEFHTRLLGIKAVFADVNLNANKIGFDVTNSLDKSATATAISLQASGKKTDGGTSVVLKGGEEIELTAAVTNEDSQAAKVIGTSGSGKADGVLGSTLSLSADKVTMKASSAGTTDLSGAYGIYTAQKDNIEIAGKDISISAEAAKFAYGIRNDYTEALVNGADISIGTAETEKVSILGSSTNDKAYGILAGVAIPDSSSAIPVPGRPEKTGSTVSTASLTRAAASEEPAAESSAERGHITVLGKEINVGASAKGMASAIQLQDNNVATIGGSNSIECTYFL